jgi:hypothetical protein
MGWTETCAVDERMRFVIAVERRAVSIISAGLTGFITSGKLFSDSW